MKEIIRKIASPFTKRVRSEQSEPLWTGDFVLTLLTVHFIFAGFSATWTTIPPFATSLGADDAFQLPLIVGAFGIMGLIIRPFGGQWVYMLGPKRVAVAGSIIVALGSLAYIFASNPWWLIPMRVLQGVGLALGPLATWTIVANLAPPTRRAEAMSWSGNAIVVASLYAPFVASFLYENAGSYEYAPLIASFLFHDNVGASLAFLFSALAASIATITCLPISANRIGFQRLAPSQEANAKADKPPLVARSAIFPMLILLTYTFSTASTTTYLPDLAQDNNLGNPGLFYTVFSPMSMLAMTVAGPIADRFGRATVIVPGLVLVAIGMFALGEASFQTMLLGSGILAGLGSGMLQPGLQSFTVDRSPVRERSAAMATLQQAWDIGGSSIGVFALGPVQGYGGTVSTFRVTGIGALIGAAGFIIGNIISPTKLPERSEQNTDAKG